MAMRTWERHDPDPFGARLTRIAVSERHHKGAEIVTPPAGGAIPVRPRPAVRHPWRRPARPCDGAPAAGAGGGRYADAAPPSAARRRCPDSLLRGGRGDGERRPGDAAQLRPLPGRLDHLLMRPVPPQDHKLRAAGRAGQPVRPLVPARRPRLQVDPHPTVGVPLQPCGPVARRAAVRLQAHGQGAGTIDRPQARRVVSQPGGRTRAATRARRVEVGTRLNLR